MALGNVPKLHGLAGILALIVALPAGCSDEFEGCKASRTCPPKGGEGGTGDTGGTSGSGGESGGGADTGGSAGSSAGSSGTSGGGGTAGTAGTDDGGSGGSGEDTEPPTVVSFTPGDGDSDVERDVAVTVELSEPIDEATVTSASVTLDGPDGEVTGTLSVEGNVITFAPDEPFNLLGTYTLTLSDRVADRAGNTLAQRESAEFHVRDGHWGARAFPFGTSVSRWVAQFQRNSAGDAVVGMETRPAMTTVYGSVYNAKLDEWIGAGTLPNGTGFATGAAIDASGLAIVAWGNSTSGYGWTRFTAAGAWNHVGALGSDPVATATPMGRATAIFYDSTAMTNASRTLNLSSGTLEPIEPLVLTDTILCANPVASLERIARLCTSLVGTQQELAVTWKAGTGWSTPEPLASAPDIQSLVADSDEQGNIMAVWREGNDIRSRWYDHETGEWKPSEYVATTTTDAQVLPPDVTAGNAIVAVNSFNATEGAWALTYRAGVGWLDEFMVRLDDPASGFAVALSIDPAGNALAVWQTELKYRRYIAGDGWLEPESLDANVDNTFYLFSASAPDGSVLVVANDLAENPNGVPMTVRFE